MNTDLHKRLEESAEKYAIKHRADYLPEDCYASEHKEGFLAGAKYGYKEAIKIAKGWLKENTYEASMILEDFETYMKKFLEDKK